VAGGAIDHMSVRFKCQFAVGEIGRSHSGVWLVWSAKKRADLYCAPLPLGGEIKASVHSPRPPERPDWRRHWGFDQNASSEVAQSAINGGRHKLLPTGCRLGAGVTLEWRIVFRGSSLCESPFLVNAATILLPIPAQNEQLEVDVLLGPKGPTKGYPHEKGTPTQLLAEGRMVDNRRIWIVYTIKPVAGSWGTIIGKGHRSSDFQNAGGELRGIGAGIESDGSLRFVEGRVQKSTPSGEPEIFWEK
jgi:hypothetical protein